MTPPWGDSKLRRHNYAVRPRRAARPSTAQRQPSLGATYFKMLRYVGVVVDAELVRHVSSKRIGRGDRLIRCELLDERVGLADIDAAEMARVMASMKPI